MLTFNAPHDPFQVPKNYFDRVQNVHDSVKRVYYGMIEALDDAVGKIVEKLKALQIEDNTLILFISDNGGATYTRATDNAPLRGGKCTHFEGGLMVPFLLNSLQRSRVHRFLTNPFLHWIFLPPLLQSQIFRCQQTGPTMALTWFLF